MQFKWTKVSFDSIDTKVLRIAGIKIRDYKDKQIDPERLIRDQNLSASWKIQGTPSHLPGWSI